MLILATAMGDLYHNRRRSPGVYPLLSAGLAAGGLALTLQVPLSKDRTSASNEQSLLWINPNTLSHAYLGSVSNTSIIIATI